MALLDKEGFDRETNLALSNWWDFGVGSGTVSADGTGPLSYGRYCNVPYGNGRTITAVQTFWYQQHLWITSAPNGDWTVRFNDSGSVQTLLGFESDLRAKVWINGASAASPLPVMALGAWYFVQWRVKIANTGGFIEVWVNGVLQHTFTGDTQLTANAFINQWALYNAGTDKFDNILIYDETGAAPNARTAETRIYSDLPTANSTAEFTPSAGSNYQCVDEQPNDGDTTYVSSTVPAVDTYGYSTSITPGSAVFAVGVELVARKDDGGTNIIEPIIEVGGVVYAGTSFGLTATYQRFKYDWPLNPATGAAWTVAQANAAKAGVRRSS